MPLRDHFRPPLDDRWHWEGMHATWPVMIVASLRGKLPPGFFAEPRVQWGRSAEIDVFTIEEDGFTVWAPPRPTLVVASDLPAQDVYEVQIYDERRRARLVAAVEIVSPANKDRPESRRAFVAKCAGLLRRACRWSSSISSRRAPRTFTRSCSILSGNRIPILVRSRFIQSPAA